MTITMTESSGTTVCNRDGVSSEVVAALCGIILVCGIVPNDTGFILRLDANGTGFIVWTPSSMSCPIKEWACLGQSNGLDAVLAKTGEIQ